MTTDTTTVEQKPEDAVAQQHKRNRKEVIALGFQNKTRGEAVFNAISYAGFGYFVVTAVSVLMTWALNDKWANVGKHVTGFPQKLFKKLPPSFGNISTLFLGGTIASVLPVKWFEDHKPEFVKKFDRFLYSDEQYHNDPKIIEAHKELDELPKQTWGSVLGSRIVAFAATLGVFLAMGSNKSWLYNMTKRWGGFSLDKMSIEGGRALDRYLGKNTSGVASAINDAIATNIGLKNTVLHGADALIDHEVVRTAVGGDRIRSRVFSYIGLDALYTLITSVTLWASTRVFGALVGQDAKVAAEKQELKHQKKAAAAHGGTHHAEHYADAEAEVKDTPPTKINSPAHLERVAQPTQKAELTA